MTPYRQLAELQFAELVTSTAQAVVEVARDSCFTRHCTSEWRGCMGKAAYMARCADCPIPQSADKVWDALAAWAGGR